MHDSQLRSFLLAARLGSFRRAAQAEHLAVQSLTQRINSLEAELGFPLFERSRAGIVLSPSGLEFYAVTEKVLQTLDCGAARCKEIFAAGRKAIRLGVVWRLPPLVFALISEFRDIHPEVNIDCVSISQSEELDDLSSGNVDLIIDAVGHHIPGSLVEKRIPTGSFQCVFSPCDPLSELEEVKASDLIGRRVIFAYGYGQGPIKEYEHVFDSLEKSEIEIVSGNRDGENTISDLNQNTGCVSLFSDGLVSLACPPLEARPFLAEAPFLISLYHRRDASATVEEFSSLVFARFNELYGHLR